ncbi:assembly machinery [Seminavis robusta]|uniref:Assembly machinery n=1 Tax=Seminavis robusta TaxID=568900 RepID=A0A9N8HD32_9STRA|nr:assembly machinery [Seminavis robusta]|eukprot:Sro440_g143530.1 assembly machinery (538) ;mRNA; f:43730-45343
MADPSQQQQRMRQQQQQAMFKHTMEYPIQFEFPATITSTSTSVSSSSDDTKENNNNKDKKPLRTDPDFLQIRLFEAGIPFAHPQSLGQTAEQLHSFVTRLEQSGCYESINVEIDQKQNQTSPEQQHATQQLTIQLKEKNWYRLYVGGGIRNDMNAELGGGNSVNSMLAKTQFETTAGLNNLTGCLDTTSLQYTVDATSQSRWDFQHVRPLDALLHPDSILASLFFSNDGDSQKTSDYSIALRAALDTLDYEWTRSYKERQRRISLTLANTNVPHAEMMSDDKPYVGFEWSWNFRDLLPRRQSTMPYSIDASPEIAAQAGPSETNSIQWEYRTNGVFCDSKLNPSQGIDYYTKAEIAGPPGDVGFAKVQSGGAVHIPLLNHLCSLHGSLHTGLLEPLSFGGACPKPPTVSDRFFVGGPLQLRGFSPAGIGPRAPEQGDALGGEFFYTATLAASMTTAALDQYGIRLFGFANVGTLAGSLATLTASPSAVVKSSRVSAGVGASAALPMGRIEATYAWPIRYGPRDMRRNVQFGLGFSFG